jgi:hypothetical protein
LVGKANLDLKQIIEKLEERHGNEIRVLISRATHPPLSGLYIAVQSHEFNYYKDRPLRQYLVLKHYYSEGRWMEPEAVIDDHDRRFSSLLDSASN